MQHKEVLNAGKNNGLESLPGPEEINRKKHQSKKEKTSKQGEHQRDLVSPMDFPERSSSIPGKDEGNNNNVTENKGIFAYLVNLLCLPRFLVVQS